MRAATPRRKKMRARPASVASSVGRQASQASRAAASVAFSVSRQASRAAEPGEEAASPKRSESRSWRRLGRPSSSASAERRAGHPPDFAGPGPAPRRTASSSPLANARPPGRRLPWEALQDATPVPTASRMASQASDSSGSPARRGPERLYYDRSTYAGPRADGGPELVERRMPGQERAALASRAVWVVPTASRMTSEAASEP